jgi:hypothetical protein
MHLFVYYKFLPSAFPNIEADARELIEQVRLAIPGVAIKLLRRPDVNDKGEHTWMEAYDCAPEQFDKLKAAVEQHARHLGLPQGRHTEVFVAV